MTYRLATVVWGLFSLWIVAVCSSVPLCAEEKPKTDQQKSDIVQNMYRKYKDKFPEVEDISAEKARALTARQQVLFVDIRKPAEQAVSTISNAVTEETLFKDLSIISGKTVVAYCTIGYRSGVFAEKLARRGIRVANLRGGILGWVHAGGKVYNARGQTKHIHVFGKKWDFAPEGYKTVVFGLWQKIF